VAGPGLTRSPTRPVKSTRGLHISPSSRRRPPRRIHAHDPPKKLAEIGGQVLRRRLWYLWSSWSILTKTASSFAATPHQPPDVPEPRLTGAAAPAPTPEVPPPAATTPDTMRLAAAAWAPICNVPTVEVFPVVTGPRLLV
jgi:hypothetical protein